jgi:hypothetical protein
VDDAVAVGVDEAGQDLADHGHRAHRHQAGLRHQDLAQGLTGDEVHHQVGRPLVEAEVGDRHAVGVGQAAHGPGLDLEAADTLVGAGVALVEELDGDRALEPDALAPIHDAHGPFGHALEDEIAVM